MGGDRGWGPHAATVFMEGHRKVVEEGEVGNGLGGSWTSTIQGWRLIEDGACYINRVHQTEKHH